MTRFYSRLVGRRVVAAALIALLTAAACTAEGPARPGASATTDTPLPTVGNAGTPTPTTTDQTTPSPTVQQGPSPTPINIEDWPEGTPFEPGAYYMDEPNMPRIYYTIPADGWEGWIPAAKWVSGPEGENQGLAISFTIVDNVVVDGCENHSPAAPPVGPAVDDLADALAALPPFELTTPPSQVTIDGYSGRHLELTVPDLPHTFSHDRTIWTGCSGGGFLKTWISPNLSFAFWGYTAPGQIEDIYILEVEGTRLLISATYPPASAPEDIAELRAIVDSIQIEP